MTKIIDGTRLARSIREDISQAAGAEASTSAGTRAASVIVAPMTRSRSAASLSVDFGSR